MIKVEYKYSEEDLIIRLRDAAKMSDALAVLLPNSGGSATAKLYNEAADAIEELSKKRKQGKWSPHGVLGWQCSECGKIIIADDENELNFCSHCGADMKEPPKEEREDADN
jgi:rubrerythrin